MEPAKVAASPNAISTVSWISPAGSMYSPQKRSTRPPSEIMAAISNCINLSFIGCFKNKTKGHNTLGCFKNKTKGRNTLGCFSNPVQRYNKKTKPPNLGAPSC